MDTAPDPRPELTAAQRIAIALGTAADPTAVPPIAGHDPGVDAPLPVEASSDTPA